ncbi:MAG: HAD family hydrolase [Spirochaetaceae bacterium]
MGELPEAVIFDVGDTLLRPMSYDRRIGVASLLAVANGEADLDGVVRFAEDLDRELEARCAPANLEFPQRAFHRLLYGHFGITFDLGESELELLYWRKALRFELEPGVPEALRALAEAGVRRAVISNTTFSSPVVEAELEDKGIASFFEFVLSSADLGVRKPDPRIFEVASGMLGVAPEACWYVGNSPFFDVRGAAGAGMRPVWYNRSGASSDTPEGTIEFSAWGEFRDLWLDA